MHMIQCGGLSGSCKWINRYSVHIDLYENITQAPKLWACTISQKSWIKNKCGREEGT